MIFSWWMVVQSVSLLAAFDAPIYNLGVITLWLFKVIVAGSRRVAKRRIEMDAFYARPTVVMMQIERNEEASIGHLLSSKLFSWVSGVF